MKYFMLAQWVMEHQNLNFMIDKITHTENSLIISFSNSHCLRFELNNNSPLLYLYNAVKQTDMQGNLLWQNLNNSSLQGVEINPRDRILSFTIKQKDIYQDINEFVLVFECMPPKPNLILCKIDSGMLKIVDAISKYAYSDNPQRQVIPGLEYEPPHTSFNPEKQEIKYPIEIKSVLDNRIIITNSMDEYFSTYQKLVIEQKKQADLKKHLLVKWQKELKKAEKKLDIQLAELTEADQMDKWLIYSEIIKVNLHHMHKGDTTLEAVNYYDPAMQKISIPIIEDKNPQENLKQYLKKYRKAKLGKERISAQISKTRQDIDNIKQVLKSFESDHWQDKINNQTDAKLALDRMKHTDSLFRLVINEHWEIVIGRKAKENDMITTQLGKPNDWWFHTRIYRGSHILLRNFHKKELSPKLAELCCGLAAWFSKARNSSNVPVDYTQIRFVRKPRKSAPGFVTYTNQKTVFVEPIEPASAKEIIQSNAL